VNPAPFAYFAPASLGEALELLVQQGPDAKLLAGGHSLLPAMKLRLAQPECLIDLRKLSDLTGVRIDGSELVIGAMTPHVDVAGDHLVQQHFPGLADAARMVGDVQVRNRGTIGGSVAHADPAADLPVMLTALEARFTLVSTTGSRLVEVGDFFQALFTTALRPDEVLTDVRVGLPWAGSVSAYKKLMHPASGYVVVSAAVSLTFANDGTCVAARVGLGGLDGVPVRADATESALQGRALNAEVVVEAASHAADGTYPDADLYASAEYKSHMATVMTRQALEVAVSRRGGAA
jgi:aerobic carbon-monoxide dehydrogenase medium subunit